VCSLLPVKDSVLRTQCQSIGSKQITVNIIQHMADHNRQEEIPSGQAPQIPQVQELPEVEEVQLIGGFVRPPPLASNASSIPSGGSSSSSASIPQQPAPLPQPVQWHWILRLLCWLITHMWVLAKGLVAVVPQLRQLLCDGYRMELALTVTLELHPSVMSLPLPTFHTFSTVFH